MKRIAIAAALVLAGAISGAALAASEAAASEHSASVRGDDREKASSDESDARGVRTAEGFFDRFRGGGEGGERRHGHRRHHWDDDDDDDDDDRDGDSASAGRGPRQADPNGATAPVPDSGVFNGKARPKVEVQ